MSLESIRERNKNGKLDKLLKAAGRTSLGRKNANNSKEEKYYPERDKNGNGSCIIRFLPGLDSEDNPYYVERFQHGFETNNNWFIEFCPATLGNDCPVCEDNRETIREYGKWDDCPENIQAVIRARGRNNGFDAGNYCNILVIKDPMNPENEGKIHMFSFGKQIMDMILDMAQPQDDGLGETPEPIDVFDLVDGANFKFIIRKKDKRADYTKSSFEAASPCPDIDLDTQKQLLPLIAEDKFKSYEELSDRFQKVINKSSKRVPKNAEGAINKVDDDMKNTKDEAEPSYEPTFDGTDQENDNMEYFKGIANEVGG